jgi:hypothetical protein
MQAKPSLVDFAGQLGGIIGGSIGEGGLGEAIGRGAAGAQILERRAIRGALEKHQNFLNEMPGAGIVTKGIKAALAFTEAGWDTLAAVLAQTQVQVRVDVLGTPTSLMPQLIDFALDVITSKLSMVQAYGAGRQVHIETDYDHRIVVATRTYALAPVSALFNGSSIDGSGGADLGGQEMGSVFQDEVPNLYLTGETKGPGQDSTGSELIGVSGPAPALLNLVAAALIPPISDPSQPQTPPEKAPQIPESETDHLESPTATE